MRPLRLTLADLPADQRLLLRAADPVPAVQEPQTGDPGGDQQKGPLRQRQGSKGGRGGRLRLTQPEPPEAVVLKAVLRYLRLRKDVAWVERLNSGAGQLSFTDGAKSQWMRFAWRGAPDLIGQMTDGRILCCEVKRPSGKLRPDQEAFLNVVRCQGGVAFVARGIEDVKEQLG